MADTNDNTLATDTPKPYAAMSDDDILEEAIKRHKACVEADDENFTQAKSDLEFLTGGLAQWDAAALASREARRAPIITVNRLPTFLHQVTNDQRQNTPAIKVSPVDSNADPDTAKTIQGLIRHIEYDSNADTAYDTAVNSAAAIGFGYFRLVTKYCEENGFDQEIRFERIRNALAVHIDPFSKEPDGCDMQYAFVELVMDKDEFKREYPDASASTAPIGGDTAYGPNWISNDSVLVCDYYCIMKEPAEVVELSNGMSGFAEEFPQLPEGIAVVRRRSSTRARVMLYKITAVDILERTEIRAKWIPIFPVYGDEVDIEGEVTRSGIIRHAKGPAQAYNVFMSAATEEIAARPKIPVIGAEGQFEGHEDEWKAANVTGAAFLEYKPQTIGNVLAPPPMRQPLSDVPAGMLALAMHASDNIKATTGLFDASLGARGTATSGRQEIAQQREGDVANFHYMDGLLRAIRHCGRTIVSMLPHYYDAERTVRIMGEDNSARSVTINEPNYQRKPLPDGRVPWKLNDLTIGKYDVVVSAGPAYTTMRQESAEFFTNAMQAAKDPATSAIVSYLAIKNQDAPGADTAAKMMATMLPPPAKQVLDQENQEAQGGRGQGGPPPEPMVMTPDGPIPASQAANMIGQLAQAAQGMQEELKRVDMAKQQTEAMRQQEALMKQQAALNDQQLEPARLGVEQKKLEADIAASNAKVAQAQADQMQAQLDIERARLEALLMPDRVRAEAAMAEEKALSFIQSAEKPEKPAAATEQIRIPSAEEIANAVLARNGGGRDRTSLPSRMRIKGKAGEYVVDTSRYPNGMAIRSPSGADYAVELEQTLQ
jgi:Phage P22-like portal protein